MQTFNWSAPDGHPNPKLTPAERIRDVLSRFASLDHEFNSKEAKKLHRFADGLFS
jgi:hypothetical protein